MANNTLANNVKIIIDAIKNIAPDFCGISISEKTEFKAIFHSENDWDKFIEQLKKKLKEKGRNTTITKEKAQRYLTIRALAQII